MNPSEMPILQFDRYPCAWPEGWDRTPPSKRRDSRYNVSLAHAYKLLVKELRLMHAKEIVVTANIPVRRDGLPYAITSEPNDPAVAVYWVDQLGKSRVIACDHWKRVRENMRAVGFAVAALRQLERCGATQVIEKAYAGFTALAAENQVRTWRAVFGMPETWMPSETELRKRYRQLILERHPDQGGERAQWDETMAAWNSALHELYPHLAPQRSRNASGTDA